MNLTGIFVILSGLEVNKVLKMVSPVGSASTISYIDEDGYESDIGETVLAARTEMEAMVDYHYFTQEEKSFITDSLNNFDYEALRSIARVFQFVLMKAMDRCQDEEEVLGEVTYTIYYEEMEDMDAELWPAILSFFADEEETLARNYIHELVCPMDFVPYTRLFQFN